MSHTEYIVDKNATTMNYYEIVWASVALLVVGASIYTYILPRFLKKKELKTF